MPPLFLDKWEVGSLSPKLANIFPSIHCSVTSSEHLLCSKMTIFTLQVLNQLKEAKKQENVGQIDKMVGHL